jgi:hypothetical protein
MVMSVSPIASPHVPQPATAPERNQSPAPAAKAEDRAAETTEDSRPPQRSGTGLTVDKHA